MPKNQSHESAQKPISLWVFGWGLFLLIVLGVHGLRASARYLQKIEKSENWSYRKGGFRLEALEITHENYPILYDTRPN